jgi:hypothetical protein
VISNNHFCLIYISQKDSGMKDSSRLKREVCKSFIASVHEESLRGHTIAVTETFIPSVHEESLRGHTIAVTETFIPSVHKESLRGHTIAVTETFKQQIEIFMFAGCV